MNTNPLAMTGAVLSVRDAYSIRRWSNNPPLSIATYRLNGSRLMLT
jgi:hypothetical protein